MNILVIDPSLIVRQFCEKVLRNAGHNTFGAPNGHLAVVVLDQNKIDLCLLNPNLPGNSGIELLYEMASYSDLAGIRTMLLTDDTYFNENKTQLESLSVVGFVERTELSKDKLIKLCLNLQKS